MPTPSEQTRNESYQSEQAVVSGKRAVVLEFVRARGSFGATREEIVAGTELTLPSVCGRVNELEEAGLLLTTSMRRIGKSGKGNSVVCAVEDTNGRKNSGLHEIVFPQEGEPSRLQATAGNGSGDSGRAEGVDIQGSGRQVRSQHLNGPEHPITAQLAALKTKPEQQLNLF